MQQVCPKAPLNEESCGQPCLQIEEEHLHDCSSLRVGTGERMIEIEHLHNTIHRETSNCTKSHKAVVWNELSDHIRHSSRAQIQQGCKWASADCHTGNLLAGFHRIAAGVSAVVLSSVFGSHSACHRSILKNNSPPSPSPCTCLFGIANKQCQT